MNLCGQGIANVLAPFFCGITATAAIASAGATSSISALVHAYWSPLVLLVLVLSWLPLSAMAALLLIVCKISEAHKVIYLLRRAPKITLLSCHYICL